MCITIAAAAGGDTVLAHGMLVGSQTNSWRSLCVFMRERVSLPICANSTEAIEATRTVMACSTEEATRKLLRSAK